MYGNKQLNRSKNFTINKKELSNTSNEFIFNHSNEMHKKIISEH